MTGARARSRGAGRGASRLLGAAGPGLVASVAALLAPPWARAGNAEAGRAKAASCTVCHGPLGLSQLPDVPHLAGQPELYLADQLRAYRSGKRPHEAMAVVAKALGDGDIADLAAWFAGIEVRAQERRK